MADNSANAVTEYAPTANAATGLNVPLGAAISASNRLWASNFNTSSVTEYAPGATGNVAPVVTISGSATKLSLPVGLTLLGAAVTTGSATGVSSTGATLNGKVNPNRVDAKYHFEYGGTTYGHSTPVVDAGSGALAVSAAATVGSLKPKTTYHFRLVASGDAGISYGLDKTFTTP